MAGLALKLACLAPFAPTPSKSIPIVRGIIGTNDYSDCTLDNQPIYNHSNLFRVLPVPTRFFPASLLESSSCLHEQPGRGHSNHDLLEPWQHRGWFHQQQHRRAIQVTRQAVHRHRHGPGPIDERKCSNHPGRLRSSHTGEQHEVGCYRT